ncbi:MAG: hypothetical protein A2017_20205 [Lentisphaerae bacterium GWF2_44_16]|nr:MAG: hypothetical protein A2017_20205 [Lentisphaerae bacterium GWF2_44_16]
MKRKTMYFIISSVLVLLVLILVFYLTSSGKEIAIYVNPDFVPNSYKYFKMDDKSDINLPLTFDITLFFEKDLKMAFPTKHAKKNKVMKVEIYTERGLCLPPGLGHFTVSFFMTKKVKVIITDNKSKEILVSINYHRKLFLLEGSFKNCRKTILTALRNAFETAEKNVRAKAENPAISNSSSSPNREQL